MEYTPLQLIGMMSFPISIVSLVLGTIQWHFHHKEIVLESLTLKDKLKVAPFFVLIILTKVWVIADTCNTLDRVVRAHTEETAWIYLVKVLPFAVILVSQVILHLKIGFSIKRSMIGGLANISSLGRPQNIISLGKSSSQEEMQDRRAWTLFRYETNLSTVTCALFTLSSITLKSIFPGQKYEMWTSWFGLALSLSHWCLTQSYINFFHSILFEADQNWKVNFLQNVKQMFANVDLHETSSSPTSHERSDDETHNTPSCRPNEEHSCENDMDDQCSSITMENVYVVTAEDSSNQDVKQSIDTADKKLSKSKSIKRRALNRGQEVIRQLNQTDKNQLVFIPFLLAFVAFLAIAAGLTYEQNLLKGNME